MSASPTRLKRTPPERSGPLRSALRQPPFVTPPAAGCGPSLCEPLENGVRTAYAVIDDYLRRGQQAARIIYNESNRQDDMNDNRGNYGGNNQWNPLAMMTGQWMSAMCAWTQAWSAMMPGMWQSPWTPTASGATPASGVPAANITVQVVSTRPVEVSANVYPGSDLSGLYCEALQMEVGAPQRIDAPQIQMEPVALRVTVRVGDQPAGRYCGYIRKKQDGSVAGEVRVTIV
jgi:hypothetical protein